ncbi:hypothetical protein [Butyricicoccus pullicaecorum]|uniref:hypothetical protein n=1 Tax=Butyricicoccus pullicaecorum TaxID=501571 RepID=UPI0039907CB1
MKGKRILTALIAAALTGGITYAYVAPIRENNTVVRWQLQTSTTQTEEMNTEVGMIYGMNTQDKPVEIYTRMEVTGQSEDAQWAAEQMNTDWSRSNLNAYDRNGNRVEGWGFDREGKAAMHLHERYDAHGNCVSQTGLSVGDTFTEYTYDEKGRIISMTQTTIDAQTGDVEYQSTTTQTYTDHADGSYTVQQSDEELMTEVVDEYDAAGNLISRRIIWDSDGRTTDYDYTYDDQNREIGVELYSDGQLRDRTVIEYDVDGLISRAITYDSTGAIIGTSESREVDGPQLGEDGT